MNRFASIGVVSLVGLVAAGCASKALLGDSSDDELRDAVPVEEPELMMKSADMVEAQIRMAYGAEPASSRVARRDAHTKHHGCVRADLRVHDDVPAAMKHGVFREPGKSFPTWIRMSNGGGGIKDDHDGDARGMAIKVVGVAGDKLLDGAARSAETQDFLMVNHPVFFIRNAKEYVEFQTVLAETGSPARFFAPGLNPMEYHVRAGLIATAMLTSKIDSPLTARYFSQSPYKLGPNVAKVSAVPCDNAPTAPPDSRTKNYLRDAMKRTLDTEDACFVLRVQLRTDEDAMPIEDPTVEWSESSSPYVPVATITIPKQAFDSAEQNRYCENLSFTPWHGLPDHEPLGGINRLRRVVYERSSRVRHELNVSRASEPTAPASMKGADLPLE